MDNRGGKRPGAGRKTVPEKKQLISVYVRPEVKEAISRKERGWAGRKLEEIILKEEA